MKITTTLLLIYCIFCLSCTDEKDGSSGETTYRVKGKVEKGPFAKGSKITLQALNSALTPTGQSYPATILDAEGNFDLGSIELESPYALLTADGYYFNEIEGELSQGQISLKALVDLTDNTSVNLNVLTHLKQDRVQSLIKNEHKSFKDANQQAQTEILTCFALQEYAAKDVSSFSIASGSDDAGALIVASSVLLHDKSDAEFTEYITDLSQEFKSNGAFSANQKEELLKNSYKLNLSRITENIIERYKSLGKEISIPDLGYYIDWDNDGIAGNELGDKDQEKTLKLEKDTLKVGVNGGTFKIKINASIPYTFNTPDGDFPNEILPGEGIIKAASIKLQNTLSNDGYLVLNIDPSTAFLMRDTRITLYSYDGKLSTKLIVQQEGDINKLEDAQSELFTLLITNLSLTLNQIFSIEALYTQCYPLPNNPEWLDFYNHSWNPNNALLDQTWEQTYRTINVLNMLADATAHGTEYSQAIFLNLRAMMYYQLVCLWNHVPFKTTSTIQDGHLPRTSSEVIYKQLKADLEKCIRTFPPQKNNNQIGVSKATPQVLLAKIYMETGDYASALPLVESVISSKQYTLSSSRHSALNNHDEELIFSLEQNQEMLYAKVTEYNKYLPVLRYTEVLLLAAECQYHLGKSGEALGYLIQVQKRSEEVTATENNFTLELTKSWKKELPGEFSYFYYLRRNHLSENELNINAFQNIFPIPNRMLELNSSLTQNPFF